MANYSILTQEEQDQIINAHLRQAEADHLNALLNAKKIAAAAKDETNADRKAALLAQANEYKAMAQKALRDASVISNVKQNPTQLEEQ